MHQILDKEHVEVISSDSWLQIAPQYELIPDQSDNLTKSESVLQI